MKLLLITTHYTPVTVLRKSERVTVEHLNGLVRIYERHQLEPYLPKEIWQLRNKWNQLLTKLTILPKPLQSFPCMDKNLSCKQQCHFCNLIEKEITTTKLLDCAGLCGICDGSCYID